MARLSLAHRVSLAASASALVVLGIYTVIAGRTTGAQVAAWEREQVAGVAHHIARMVDGLPPGEIERSVAETSPGLEPFGVELTLSSLEGVGDGRSVSVPLANGRGFIVARASEDLSATLRRRLARSSLGLAPGLVVALLLAIQGAVHWGVVQPLRRVRRQLRLMARGPWRVTIGSGGVPEIEELARQIEGVGASLEHSISEWVAAERRAAAECARIELRPRASPSLRAINLNASQLLAADGLEPAARRTLRRLLDGVDALAAALGEPMDSPRSAPGAMVPKVEASP